MTVVKAADTKLIHTRQLHSYISAMKKLKTQNTPFVSASPSVKYLGTNQIKYVQDLYEANYKTPINEINELH